MPKPPDKFDLLDRNDPLLKSLPGEFLGEFDPGHAGRRIPPYMVRRQGLARLAAAEYLRRGWQQHFGHSMAARLLNEARFAAVCRALDEEYDVIEIAWAIVAYHRDCTTSKGRLANSAMRRTFESFLAGGVLELWVPLGQKLRDDQADAQHKRAQRRQQRRTEQTFHGLLDAFNRLPNKQQQQLIDAAAAELKLIGKGINHPAIRARVLRDLQQQLQGTRKLEADRVGTLL